MIESSRPCCDKNAACVFGPNDDLIPLWKFPLCTSDFFNPQSVLGERARRISALVSAVLFGFEKARPDAVLNRSQLGPAALARMMMQRPNLWPHLQFGARQH